MKKHVNYQYGILTIDPHRIANALVTDVGEIIRAVKRNSDEVLSASIGSIETLDQQAYLEEHSTS